MVISRPWHSSWMILAIAVGVLLGTVGGDVLTVLGMLREGELYGLSFRDIPGFLLLNWQENPEYRQGVISNIGTGLLFAALGVFAILKRTGREVSGTQVVELK